jgi:hypothetical protein
MSQMTWFENKKRVWIWNSNRTTLIIVTYCLNIVVVTMTLGVSQPSPLIEIWTRDLEGVAVLTGTVNSHTFHHYGNMKSEWWEWRKSSLSRVASSLVWLLHCILKNLMILCLMTRSFWSKFFIGCLGYDRSGNTWVLDSSPVKLIVSK